MNKDVPRLHDSPFPEFKTLEIGIRSVLRKYSPAHNQITIVNREPSIYTTTFATEIVTCRFLDGNEVRLFCKYGTAHLDDIFTRSGVSYEVEVYENILRRLPFSTPRFYGTYEDQTTGRIWLLLEYLDNHFRINKTTNRHAMNLAARWIGQFHATTNMGRQSINSAFLKVYDAEYYLGWARQALRYYATHQPRNSPWLAILCGRFSEVVDSLLCGPLTVIHGEYYPQNILVRDCKIYPVDWESTAVAAGEIDLATLIQAWPEHVRRECTVHYQQARWPEGAPADFERSLCAAQLYLHFRWFSDWAKPSKRKIEWWLDCAAELGRQLRLI
jgi:hypothetical protein